MARPKPWEVDDELWAVIEPLLPRIERRTRHPGGERHPDRPVFQGILFVPHTGITWEHLPQELGFGSGMTCWRRLAEWAEAGVRPRLHKALLAELRGANALDFSRAAVHGSRIRALKGGAKTGRSPVDRGGTGSKHRLITDATGTPLAAALTGGNRNDATQLIPLLQAVPPVRGKRGRPRRRPDVILADRGHDKYRRLVRALDAKPLIARRGTEHGSGLGTRRWVVERAFAHLHWFRRLRIRGEVRDDIHEAFPTLGCAPICWRRLVSLHAQQRLAASRQRSRTAGS
ncbi:IS5 family transposase [Streptomyces sp. Tu 3180]|uniref:IS5 family transposase n=1 Tax=Streptomyces sp. Tu 3180 TaxID=2682611 RepID=UPI0013595343|nr:IS5 family transposase [Streptomyces sp. Tu 3180]KAF3463184.1 IS5 family transposase [Streptomyces sp. Tu 3180]